MKNKITDLNNHLFAQLERLGDEDLTNDDLDKEIQRSKAITLVAEQIVQTSMVQIDAMKILERSGVNLTHYSSNILELKSSSVT